MKFELHGQLHELASTKQITDKFKKREFVLAIPSGNYMEHIKCETTGDTCSKLDNAKIGDQIYAKCAMRGRYFTKKDGTQGHMNTVIAYSIESSLNANPENSLRHILSTDAPF